MKIKKPSPYVDLRFKKILNVRSNYWALFQYFDESYVDMPRENSMLTISGFSYSGPSQPDLFARGPPAQRRISGDQPDRGPRRSRRQFRQVDPRAEHRSHGAEDQYGGGRGSRRRRPHEGW